MDTTQKNKKGWWVLIIFGRSYKCFLNEQVGA